MDRDLELIRVQKLLARGKDQQARVNNLPQRIDQQEARAQEQHERACKTALEAHKVASECRRNLVRIQNDRRVIAADAVTLRDDIAQIQRLADSLRG